MVSLKRRRDSHYLDLNVNRLVEPFCRELLSVPCCLDLMWKMAMSAISCPAHSVSTILSNTRPASDLLPCKGPARPWTEKVGGSRGHAWIWRDRYSLPMGNAYKHYHINCLTINIPVE